MRCSLVFAALVFGLGLGACKTRSGGDELKEAWFNLMDSKWKPVQEASDRNEYIRTFATLPTQGEVTPLPWSNLERSDISPNINQAVASILFAEPSSVQANSEHSAYPAPAIKALLVSFVAEHSTSEEGVEARSLGGVCRLDSDSYRKALEPRATSLDAMRALDQNQCFSVNAGAFHLAVTNFIGLRNLSFIIDPDIDQEFVYNPITKFRVDPLGVSVTVADNHTQLPIKNTVTYLLPTGELKSTIYRYTLEMDETGDIVNGEWLGKTAPQTVWMQNRPKFGPGDRSLEELYTSSVSLPVRMAMQDFSSLDVEDPKVPVRDQDPLVINHKYRLELSGDVPRGADSAQTFLHRAFQNLGNISIYRNTFADEDRFISIEVQVHGQQTFAKLKQAVRDHSNGRAEIERILR